MVCEVCVVRVGVVCVVCGVFSLGVFVACGCIVCVGVCVLRMWYVW